MLNIIPRRFVYSGVGSSVGLLGTGLYRNILFGLLGSSLGEEIELPAGILIECTYRIKRPSVPCGITNMADSPSFPGLARLSLGVEATLINNFTCT